MRQSGAIRILAVSSEPARRATPARADRRGAGYPGYKAVTWNGLMAPAGTPKPIVDKIAAEIAKACKEPKFVERLPRFGADPSGITPRNSPN